MKRILCILMLLSILFSLIGCQTRQDDRIRFYYCREPKNYQYYETDSVICAEDRVIPNHNDNLRYIIGLYLAGPSEEGLRCPLPQNVKIMTADRSTESVKLTFSDLGDSITDVEFTIACACLTMTCVDLTGCTQVTVISGERSLTMTTESFRLVDSAIPEPIEGD